ncbi:MAG: CopY family transcriptional regulator [Coleofasciculaceae cyanobacterium RL_1_1]|nr:CopY family transcriptional regulator [Coleofasciculaceae cyanobacterium RL_1_1]
MTAFPEPQPKRLFLGSLESEIIDILWDLEPVTARSIHERILSDPDRELAYSSVTTILQRLEDKGWVKRTKQSRAFLWSATIDRQSARVLRAREHLSNFLELGNADVVAAFADNLDRDSLDRLDAIAQRLRDVRRQREEEG